MQFKTKPREKQVIAFNLSEGKKYFAYFMEMRTGKSKVTLDDAARAYLNGEIDCLVVMAPNGVHSGWIEEQCVDHMAVPYVATYYSASAKVAHKREYQRIVDLRVANKLKVIAYNIESAANKRGQQEIMTVLNTHKCMLVVDESDCIKSPTASCTKFLLKVAPKAVMRRDLTGTPITQSPLGLFTQIKFLHPNILNQTTFTAFKARYAQVKKVMKATGIAKLKQNGYKDIDPASITWSVMKQCGISPGRDMYEEVVGHKNMDELSALIAPYCYRLKASECEDLPVLVPMRLRTTLKPEQRRIYNEMMDKLVAHLTPQPDSPQDLLQWYLDNDKIEASNALTKFLRAQQVLGGYVPDSTGNLRKIEHNRLKTLMEFIPQIQGKAIVWAKFKPEIAEICDALRAEYGADSVVEFHGSIKPAQRIINKEVFQDPDSNAKFLVGQPRAGGVGHTFDAADTVIFYSHDHSARMRWQAEVRASAVGKQSIAVVDIVAPGTVDVKILKSLEKCRKTAEEFDYGNNRSVDGSVLFD